MVRVLRLEEATVRALYPGGTTGGTSGRSTADGDIEPPSRPPTEDGGLGTRRLPRTQGSTRSPDAQTSTSTWFFLKTFRAGARPHRPPRRRDDNDSRLRPSNIGPCCGFVVFFSGPGRGRIAHPEGGTTTTLARVGQAEPAHPRRRDDHSSDLSSCVRGTRSPRGLAAFGNDPSAGSPTETLLRLLLPLDSQV